MIEDIVFVDDDGTLFINMVDKDGMTRAINRKNSPDPKERSPKK